MRRIILFFVLSLMLLFPASAMESEPPVVPDSGELYMPDNTESFGEGLWYVFRTAMYSFLPEVKNSAGICLSIIASVMLLSILSNFSNNQLIRLCSTVFIGGILLNPAGVMIQLGQDTVTELASYGKLLVPVLTGALAAQGGVTTSSSLYVITVFAVTFLTAFVTKVIVPIFLPHGYYECISGRFNYRL